jgi:hypothetical protein
VGEWVSGCLIEQWIIEGVGEWVHLRWVFAPEVRVAHNTQLRLCLTDIGI